MGKKEPSFSLSDFKKWMSSQHEQPVRQNDLVGVQVESKIRLSSLLEHIEVNDGDLEEVAKDFKKNGGTILEATSEELFVQVDVGNFRIPKHFCKKS